VCGGGGGCNREKIGEERPGVKGMTRSFPLWGEELTTRTKTRDKELALNPNERPQKDPGKPNVWDGWKKKVKKKKKITDFKVSRGSAKKKKDETEKKLPRGKDPKP